ncbi:hypothetical protein [Roseiconus nitratireducens]|nr:hypothetical protein [Roseiconus nitratireducens]
MFKARTSVKVRCVPASDRPVLLLDSLSNEEDQPTENSTPTRIAQR